MATPASGIKSLPARDSADRRLRLEDILKLMVSDGLVSASEADRVALQWFERWLQSTGRS